MGVSADDGGHDPAGRGLLPDDVLAEEPGGPGEDVGEEQAVGVRPLDEGEAVLAELVGQGGPEVEGVNGEGHGRERRRGTVPALRGGGRGPFTRSVGQR